MVSNRCVICGTDITATNDSKEHLIPNSIGGFLKVRGFICEPCNNSTGAEWDVALAKSLNPLSLFFRINRDRGDVPSQNFNTTAGESLTLHPEGKLSPTKPNYEESEVEEGTRIQISARSMKEAKQMLKGVKRKYPKLDLDGTLQDAKTLSKYPDGMLHFELSLGGPLAGRSIIKTALAFVHHCGLNTDLCSIAVEYLRNPDASPSYGYYYERDIIVNRPLGVPIHCVAVSCDPDTGQMLAYVEYFGCQRIVTCLSDTYTGPKFASAYAINPITSEVLPVSVNMDFNAQDISDIYGDKRVPNGSVDAAFGPVIEYGLKVQSDEEIGRVTSKAVEKAFATCGAAEGEKLTQEHVNAIMKTLGTEMEPLLLHILKEPKR
jgi:hypothetical protein